MKNVNKAPRYCPKAIGTKKGWVDPKTGELLVSCKSLDLDEISKTNEIDDTPLIKPAEEVEAEEIIDAIIQNNIDVLVGVEKHTQIANNSQNVFGDADSVDTLIDDNLDAMETAESIIDLEEMSKTELLDYAKTVKGKALSKRDNKTTLIEKIKEL